MSASTMNAALWRKNLHEARGLLIACALGLFAFCWVRVWIVSLLDMSQFEAVIEQFRKFERFSPVPFDQLFTWPGRVSLLFDEPLVWGLVCTWAIARGSDSVSGEIGRGTMEMLLAQPISRWQLLSTHVAVTLLGLLVLGLAVWLGLAAGIAFTTVELVETPSVKVRAPFLKPLEIPLLGSEKIRREKPLGELVKAGDFVPGVVNLMALGFFMTGLTTLCSACDRYRWRTLALSAGYLLVSMAFKLIGRAAPAVHWLLYGSCLSAYEPQAAVLRGREPEGPWRFWVENTVRGVTECGPLGYDMILVLLGGLALIAATLVFCRRDLPAPL